MMIVISHISYMRIGWCGDAELIFVTNITNYIHGGKIVTWRNIGKFWEILGNFEKVWEILPQFMRFHVEKDWAQKTFVENKL